MSTFENTWTFITGGSKGLGKATAIAFAKNKSHIALTYRSDKEAAEETKSEIESLGVQCLTWSADLSDPQSTENLIHQIEKSSIHFNQFIFNAAATAFLPLMEIKPHHYEKTFNISVGSLIQLVQNLAPKMSQGSSIVTVSGMDNLRVVPRHGLLGAAKSALEQLTVYFAHELAPQKIRVNSINPGFFETESTQKFLGPIFNHVSQSYADNVPTKEKADINDIANIILFLCKNESYWINGKVIVADGGFQESLGISLSP